MIKCEILADPGVPGYLNTEEPFNENSVKHKIGEAKVIIHSVGRTKVSHTKQQEDNPSLGIVPIGYPVLEYEFEEGHVLVLFTESDLLIVQYR
jgi:hypothetical protein